jgi:RNA polymerase sigma factor (sigma-70 family)
MGELSDPAAFRALFDAQFAAVHRYLAHRLGDAGAAEDLAAETFLRAYQARSRFCSAHAGSARAWLFAIATNLLRDDARGRGRRDAAVARLAGRATAPAAELDFEDRDPQLAIAVAGLRAEEREALLLFAWAELSYEEIAATMGVAVGTVRSRLARARARLADELAPLMSERSTG